MKGKRVIAGILLAGILSVSLAGCKNTENTKEETEKLVILNGAVILENMQKQGEMSDETDRHM